MGQALQGAGMGVYRHVGQAAGWASGIGDR